MITNIKSEFALERYIYHKTCRLIYLLRWTDLSFPFIIVQTKNNVILSDLY